MISNPNKGSVNALGSNKKYNGEKIKIKTTCQLFWNPIFIENLYARKAEKMPQMQLNIFIPNKPNCAKGDDNKMNIGLPQWCKKNFGYF